jgi:uncharacterized protein (UPF0264 family)
MLRNPQSFEQSADHPADVVADAVHSSDRCQWLVSVRDRREATCATKFGVDILDVKEPSAGPLAPASVDTWREICGMADRHDPRQLPPFSAALGESEQAVSVAPLVPPSFHFAKAGPSHCIVPSQPLRLWDTLRNRLPKSVELVAVAYADHQAAHSLPPEHLLELAARAGLNRILVDTYDKSKHSAIDTLGPRRLLEFGRLANDHGIWWSLAGSLKLEDLNRIDRLFADPGSGDSASRPNCLAVRGDVCDQNRCGTLCPIRMKAWSNAVHVA